MNETCKPPIFRDVEFARRILSGEYRDHGVYRHNAMQAWVRGKLPDIDIHYIRMKSQKVLY